MAFKITKDGKKQASARTYNEALMKLHKLSPHSWHHSMTYEGWAIKKEKK